MQQRIDYLDFAKGIGIFLVIVGHAVSPRPAFLYSFHMPLFLFISGYLFRVKPMKETIVSKFSRLYIPYAFFYIVTWGISSGAHFFSGNTKPVSEELFVLSKVLIGYEGNGGNTPIWFISALFSMCIIYNLICLATKNNYLRSFIIILLSALGNYMYWHKIELPYQLDSVFSAIPFFHLGFLLSKVTPEMVRQKLNTGAIFGIMLLLLIIQIITYRLNLEYDTSITYVNVFVNKVGNYFYYYIPGICGAFWFIALCYIFKYNKVVNFYGNNTLVILGFHDILVTSLLRVMCGKNDAPLYAEILVSLTVLLICTGLIFLCKKYVPRLTGYKPALVLTKK